MVLIGLCLLNIVNIFMVTSAKNYDDYGDKYLSSNEIIALINSSNSTWTAGHNFPPETTKKYLRGLAGTILEEDDSSILERVVHDPDFIASLPESFDSRKQWPNCPSLNHVRNRGACGNDWAMAVVEVITDRYCIMSNGTKQFYFSAQDPTSCDYRNRGCDGGYVYKTYWWWTKLGIVSGGDYGSNEGCYPYEVPPTEGDIIPTPECHKSCTNGDENEYKLDKKFAENAFSMYSEEDMMAEIYKNGPITSLFTLYEDFMVYKKGVYQHQEGELIGNLAVKTIGWGVEDGLKYWLVVNSLGKNWGDDGYFKILRGKNECKFEQISYTGLPKYD